MAVPATAAENGENAGRAVDWETEQLTARLRRDPQDIQAYEALKKVYRSRNDPAALLDLIVEYADRQQSFNPAEASRAYREAADIALHETGDAFKATESYQRSLQANPLNVDAAEELNALLERQGDFQKQARFLQELYATLQARRGDPAYLALLCYRLGDLWNQRFQRPETALDHYRRALEHEPNMLAAMFEARQIHLNAGDFDSAAELYRMEVEAETDRERKAQLSCELAELRAEQLGDLDEAISVLRAALAISPGDVSCMHLQATFLIRKADGLSPKEARKELENAAELLFHIAQGLPDQTAIEYAQSALSYAPDHEEALKLLERLATTSGQLHILPAYWVGYLASRPDGPNTDERRLALAQAYVAGGQDEDALYCLKPAARRGHPEASALFERLRKETGIDPFRVSEGEDREQPAEPEVEPETISPSTDQPAFEPETVSPSTDQPAFEPETVASAEVEPTFEPETVSPEKVVAKAGPAPPVPPPLPAKRSAPRKDPTAPIEREAAAAEPGRSEPKEEKPGYIGAEELAARPSDFRIDDAKRDLPPKEDDESAVPTVPPPTRKKKISALAPELDLAEVQKKAVADRAPEAPAELPRLRKAMREAAAARNHEDAEAYAKQILELDAADSGAFALLERYYRRQRDFRKLRDLLIEHARSPSLPLETRKTRLRDAAALCTDKLKDADGAIRAWREMAALDPDDADTSAKLKMLLQDEERWDDLLEILDGEAMAAADAEREAELIEQIALIHLDRRRDLVEAADAFRQLYALKPGDDKTRDVLCEVLLEDGQYEEAIPLIEKRIDACSDQKRKLGDLHKLASLLEEKLDDAERARATYERILTFSRDDEVALDRMERIDERSGQPERLLFTLERRAERAAADEKAALYQRMASVAESELSDPDRAAEYLGQAVEHAPEDENAIQALCDLLERDNQHEKLKELLHELAAREEEPQRRAQFQARIARLCSEWLGDEDAAADAWRAVLEIREDPEALEFMRYRAERQDDPEQLAAILKRLSALERDAEQKRDLLLELGKLLSERLDRSGDAVAVFRTILDEIDPACDAAVDEMLAACEAAGDRAGVADALERKLEREKSPHERVELARRLADIFLAEPGEGRRAIRVLQVWAEQDQLDPEPHRRLLQPLEANKRFKEMIAELDALADLEPDAEARQLAAVRAAELVHTSFKDADGAWQRLAPLVEEGFTPASKALASVAAASERLEDLYELLESAGRYSELAELLEEGARGERNAGTRLELYRRLARVSSDWLGNEEAAAEAWQRVLEIRDDVEALEFIRWRAAREDDNEKLLDILKRLSELQTDNGDKRDLLFEYARIAHGRLDRSAEAVEVLERILAELDSSFEPAIDEMLTVCEAVADHPRLAVALERKLGVEEQPEVRAELAQRLADLLTTEIDDPKRAVTAMQRWAEVELHNPEPHRRLRPLLERTKRFKELLVSLDALAFLEPEEEERRQAALAAAELAFGEFRDAAGAWERLAPLIEQGWEPASRIIVAVAEKADRLDELCELLERAHRYSELVEILQDRVEAESRPEARVEILRRIARTKANRLGDDEGAEQVWNNVLEIKEDIEALQFMRSAAVQRDEVERLADILKRLAALVGENEERRDLFFEYAYLLNKRLERPRDAMEVIRVILDAIDPRFEPAIDELIAIAESLGNQAALAEALEKRLAMESDPEWRIEVAQRLARIYESEIKDAKRAVRALQSWAEADPGTLEPRRKLRELLLDSRRYKEAVEVLDVLAEMEEEERERESAAISAAEVLSEKLSDPEGAWKRLTPLVLTSCDAAEDALHALARKFKQEQRLADLYTALAQQAVDAKTSASHWQSAARVFEEYLGQPEQALEALLRRLAIDMQDRSYLDDVERLAAESGAWPRMAQVYARLLKQTRDPGDQAELLIRHADLLENKADDPRAALDLVLKACSLDPQNDLWLERADKLCRQTESTDELLWIYERRLQNADTKGKRIDLLIDAARMVDRVAKDREQAIAYFREALRLCGGSTECIDRIELTALRMDKDRPVGEEQDVRRALIDTYRELARTPDPDSAISLLLRASRLLSAALNDDHGSFDILKEALVRFPENQEVYTTTEELAVRIGRLDALDAQMARLLARDLPEETRVAVLERRLGLLLGKMNRYDEAVDICRKLLELNPEHAEAARSLELSLEKSGRYLELVRHLELRLEEERDRQARIEIMRTIATLWEDQLVNRWEAGEMWTMILDVDPGNAEALNALERLKMRSPTSVHPPPPDE